MVVKKQPKAKLSKAQLIAAEVNKQLGAGTLRMGNDQAFATRRLVSGLLPVDHMLDGGFPRNRTTELYGDYSTLKSFIGLCAIAAAQARGEVCALIDTEHSFDEPWAIQLGVNTDDLILEQPESGEAAVDITESLIRQDVDLIIWDSVAATLPQAERRKRLKDETVQMARLAALMSLAMRKLTAANANTALVFINQTRMNVGIVFGNPETTPGGKALPFYASYRMSLRKAGKVTQSVKSWDGEKFVTTKRTLGQKIKLTMEKSKLSAPFTETWFTFDLKAGKIDEAGYLMTLGVEKNLIMSKGATWTSKTAGITARGAGAFRGKLEADLTAQNKLRAALNLPGIAVPAKRKVSSPKKRSLVKRG